MLSFLGIVHASAQESKCESSMLYINSLQNENKEYGMIIGLIGEDPSCSEPGVAKER